MTGKKTNEEIINMISAGGDRKALLCELYENNRGLITRWARMFSGAVEFEDLMQECFLALCAALSGFNSSSGVLFASYLETVVKRHLARVSFGSGALHLSDSMAEDVMAYRWERMQYEIEIGADPDDRTIADRLSWKLEKVQRVRRVADLVTVSLDKPMTEDGATLAETLEDGRDPVTELIDRESGEDAARELWKIVSGLPEEQAEVIRQRYQQGRTRAAIGRESGKTVGQIARAEELAIKSLKRKRRRLEDIIDYYGIRTNDTGLSLFNRTWESSVERAAIKRNGWR